MTLRIGHGNAVWPVNRGSLPDGRDPSGTQEYATHCQECLSITFHHPGSLPNAEAPHHLMGSGRRVAFQLHAMTERQSTGVFIPGHFWVHACDRRTRRDPREREQQTRPRMRGAASAPETLATTIFVCLSNP